MIPLGNFCTGESDVRSQFLPENSFLRSLFITLRPDRSERSKICAECRFSFIFARRGRRRAGGAQVEARARLTTCMEVEGGTTRKVSRSRSPSALPPSALAAGDAISGSISATDVYMLCTPPL